MFSRTYSEIFTGDARWQGLEIASGDRYAWDNSSTYIRRPPYFDAMTSQPEPIDDIHAARVLAVLGDSVTTDHISPAGAIRSESPAGRWLIEHGVEPDDFNSYGARRGNHEVMIRGTFANRRLRNRLVDVEGGVTRYLPTGDQMSIFDAAERYRVDGVPLVVLAGQDYGSGSSRDWAAKGTALLGVRAVIAESYERIHRSNLIGMGVLPLQFPGGKTADDMGLTGEETISITGITELNPSTGSGQATGTTPRTVTVKVESADGERADEFEATVRIDTPGEANYYRNGGIMQYVLRNLLKG